MHPGLVRVGQALMIIGVLLALEHVGAHLGAFGQQPPLLIDMVAGWPMAGFLVIAGLVLAGQRQYHLR